MRQGPLRRQPPDARPAVRRDIIGTPTSWFCELKRPVAKAPVDQER